MQKLQATPCAAAMFGRIIRAGVRIIREIEARRQQKVCNEADDLGPVPDDPGGGRTIRVEVRTSGQLFLLQTLENGPKHRQDGLGWKRVQRESCASRRDG